MTGLEPALIVAAAAAISAAIILALLPLLQRYALAHPNARSSHRTPTPQGGGIAVVVATIAVIGGALAIWQEPSFDPRTLGMVLSAMVFIAIVGAWDDIRSIGVVPRLLLQTLAVGIVIASLPPELRIVPMLPWWGERALLLLACLWFVNLTNFMDGIDWMSVAEFVPVSIGLVVVGWCGALPMYGVLVALALCGGLIGFAPFNRPVARIFLGDVGSLPIGLVFAWLLVLVAGSGHLAAAVILPFYYLADASLTLLRRIKNRETFWLAHRTHYYQLATSRGFSVPAIVARVFIVNAALVALAIATVLWPGPGVAAIASGCAAVLVGGLLRSFARGRP
jgi:UDP-N-acetylmuramyl pentapeptide phosphotransferase/UDP-N-acetylglucosamine-1-phosphate transferase